jgi:hypothetical protein
MNQFEFEDGTIGDIYPLTVDEYAYTEVGNYTDLRFPEAVGSDIWYFFDEDVEVE